MTPTILGAALELARIHGRVYATYFLSEYGVTVDVIGELLDAFPKNQLPSPLTMDYLEGHCWKVHEGP